MAPFFDTIILGAGWSGAIVARDLARCGRKVLVLEARDRIGGRARTWISAHGDAKVDIGCSWIHGYYEGNPARYIAQSLGVPANVPRPAEGVIIGPTGPLNAEQTADLRGALRASVLAYRTPHPTPPPNISLAEAMFSAESPLQQAEEPNLARGFARTLEVPLGLKLEKASLRWCGWESSTNYAGSDAAPQGGYQALVGRVLADAIEHGATVQLNSEVTNISDGENHVTVTTINGEKFTGRTVVCTIPLGVLQGAAPTLFDPVLPTRFADIMRSTHVGVLEKLVMRYPQAWWPRATEIGSYTFLPARNGDDLNEESPLIDVLNASTLTMANFASPSLPGPTPTLLTYLSETPARLLVRRSIDEVSAAFHQFLMQRFQPNSIPPPPSEAEITRWLLDPHSRGATTTPSIISENGERSPLDFKELSRPLWDGRLGFAGEHTEMDNRGSVAGAVISGQREAARVERLLQLIV